MISRQVTKTKKDVDGDILALCKDYASWSPRSKNAVIADIKSGLYNYYVLVLGKRVDIHVFKDKYLRTGKDETTINNLDLLPDCI